MLASPASAAPDFNATTELCRACSDTEHLEGQTACLAFLANQFRHSQSRAGNDTCLPHAHVQFGSSRHARPRRETRRRRLAALSLVMFRIGMRCQVGSGSEVSFERDQRLSGVGESRHDWRQIVQIADVRNSAFRQFAHAKVGKGKLDYKLASPDIARPGKGCLLYLRSRTCCAIPSWYPRELLFHGSCLIKVSVWLVGRATCRSCTAGAKTGSAQ